MRAIKLCAVGALQFLLCGFAAAQAQQPATLTLACKGTLKSSIQDSKPETEPISMRIVVNFATRTVQGLPCGGG
jgi:hypothetical protein